MERARSSRTRLVLAAGALLLLPLLAACGDDDTENGATGAGPDTTVPATPPGDGGGDTRMMALLDIDEALALDDGTPVSVQGFLVGGPSGYRLCEALAESFPPQCGGSFLVLTDAELALEQARAEGLLQEEGEVVWTDAPINVFGFRTGTDGLRVDPEAADADVVIEEDGGGVPGY